MGEGNFRPKGAVTRQCHPFDEIDRADPVAANDAWNAFIDLIGTCLSDRWCSVERAWKRCGSGPHARIIAQSGLHEVTVYENSYACVFVSLWARHDLDPRSHALAEAQRARIAEAFFRRLSCHLDLFIATSAWTSAIWVPATPRGEARS
ncbi:MAG: hypothetical protein AAGH68_02290 [Pseudomonadota bacterium]